MEGRYFGILNKQDNKMVLIYNTYCSFSLTEALYGLSYERICLMDKVVKMISEEQANTYKEMQIPVLSFV
ncbi:hypothetical protein CN515_04205 [Bacillus cereus]|uniref:hypothetical protein n=1 Tax=Bacillus cereus TaxID=1396 RepID=UPI000BF8A278|nr:hypothetical protein [Bacillus cereus]PES55260.1 hypothetical protein CN515_04205 [Bacillus cereus]